MAGVFADRWQLFQQLRQVPPANRKRLGISDSLIRLSVGIEDVRDLRHELEAALG